MSSAGYATISAKTNFLYFQTECKAAPSPSITSDATTGNFTIQASLSPNCVQTVTGGNNNDGRWHGVVGVAANACITDINPNATYPSTLPQSQSPVAFGLYANNTVASMVFCFAFQYEYTGTAHFNLTSNSLRSIDQLQLVSSSPFQNFAYNG